MCEKTGTTSTVASGGVDPAASSQSGSDAGVTAAGQERRGAADDAAPGGRGLMARFDGWAAQNPWHVRFAPFMAYIILLAITGEVRHLASWAFIPAYIAQCGVTAWLLWRYRKLIPEMNLRFHWLAIPFGVGVVIVWVYLGYGMMAIGPDSFADPGYIYVDEMGPAMGWAALSLRLLGMSIVVPLFEEVFHRSLTLRSLSHPRWTAIGVMNLLQDLPLVDDLVRDRDLARRAGKHEAVFAKQFYATPLGRLTIFGVAASTLIFCTVHSMRDWPACIFTGVVWCLLVAMTNNRKRQLGLGPVIWAHAITNALLWVYAVRYDAWYFLP